MKRPNFAVGCMITTTLVLLLMTASSAFADQQPKFDVCHWTGSQQGFVVINISGNAVDAHIQNHGDSYAGTYWPDADGDGYGDPNGATDVCPHAGYVDNSNDCNDADPAVNSGAAETCGDGIDNDCNGAVDEGCVACPCFTTEQLDAAFSIWNPEGMQYATETCTIYDYSSYNYTLLYWYGSSQSSISQQYQTAQYYSVDYDDYGMTYCQRYEHAYDYNNQTGQYANYVYNYDMLYITDEEHVQCEALLQGWADMNGFTCDVYGP